MKHTHRILPLICLSFVLTGCQNNTASSRPNTNGSTSASSSTTSPSKPSSGTESTSQKPSVRPEDIDKEAIVSELIEGFAGESLITSGSEFLGYTENYFDFEVTSDAYSFRRYQSGEVGLAKKDYIASSGLYEPFTNSGTKYLTVVELGIDNKLHNYYLTSNSNYLTWDDAGYFNPFYDLFGDDFTLDEEDPFRLNLNMDDSSKKSIYNAFATAFTGTIGYTLKSFTLLTDGTSATGYEMTFENIKGTYGTTETHLKGTIKEEKGPNVVQKKTPIEGTEKEDLNARFKQLKTGNYKAEVTLPNRSYKAEVYGNNSVSYDLFRNGKKTGNYGYYQIESGKVQGITKINDSYYQDSNPITGSMSSMIPSFDISSVLFEKDEASTSEKTIYTMDKSVSEKLSVEGITYGLLGGTILGTLKIELENNKTTIINDLGDIGEERFVYTDIASVTDFTKDVKESCDDLTWSDLFSNQPNEYAMLTEENIPGEFLDQIPTLGGKSSYVTIAKNNKTGLIQTVIAIEDYKDGENKVEAYKTKAEALGFASEKISGQTPNYILSKKVTINGITKTVSIDILLAASYFNTPTIVVSFSSK